MTALPLEPTPAPEPDEAVESALFGILAALRTVRLGRHGMLPHDVHERIAHALADRGIAHQRGHAIGGARAALWVPVGAGGIALQFGSPAASVYDIVRDLRRLARHPDVRALVLALDRPLALRPSLEGKPCKVVALASFGGFR